MRQGNDRAVRGHCLSPLNETVHRPQAPNTGHRIPGTEYRAPGTGHRAECDRETDATHRTKRPVKHASNLQVHSRKPTRRLERRDRKRSKPIDGMTHLLDGPPPRRTADGFRFQTDPLPTESPPGDLLRRITSSADDGRDDDASRWASRSRLCASFPWRGLPFRRLS